MRNLSDLRCMIVGSERYSMASEHNENETLNDIVN